MSRLRIATDDDIKRSGIKPFIELRHFGEIYLVVIPEGRGLDLVFIKLLPTGAPAPLPAQVPKHLCGEFVALTWLDRLLGLSLRLKVSRVIAKWRQRLCEYDDILDSTGGKYLSFMVGGD